MGFTTWRPALVLLAAVALGGCGKGVITSQIEQGIEARLPAIIGPAKSYDVHVSGRTFEMIKGRMATVSIHGEEVRVTPNLALDDLRVTLSDVVFDKRSQKIASCQDACFRATIREATLNQHLRATKPKLRDLRVRLQKDRMLVHLRPSLASISLGVDVEGTLRIGEPAKIYFEVDRLALAGIKMPALIADYVEEKINPLSDLSQSGLTLHLSSVTLMPGALEMTGSLDLASALSTSNRRPSSFPSTERRGKA